MGTIHRCAPLLACLLACSSSSSSPSGSSSSSSSGNGGNTTINGKPADQFYGQFAYETIKTDMEGAGAMASQDNGDNAYLLNLFLKEDKSFVLFYVEGQGEVSATGNSIQYDPKKGRKVSGTWSIDGASLVVGPFACDGLNFNGRDVISCEVKQAIVSDGAVGHTAMLDKGEQNASPNDSQFADYK
jgi:hypothetical protein